MTNGAAIKGGSVETRQQAAITINSSAGNSQCSINGTSITSTNTTGVGVQINQNASASIKNANIEAPNRGIQASELTNTQVDGGTITATNGVGIQINGGDGDTRSTLNVSNATIKGKKGIRLINTNGTISGSGTINGTDGTAVIIDKTNSRSAAGILTITGETFDGSVYYVDQDGHPAYTNKSNEHASIYLKGGTFNTKENLNGFLQDGYHFIGNGQVVQENSGGTTPPSQPSTPSKPPVNDGLYWSDGHLYSTWARNQWVGNYFFDGAGRAVQGWYGIGGYQYYFGSDYQRDTGWQKISGKQYYFDYLGRMATGEYSVSNKDYYFGSDGVMRTGVVKVSSGKIYDFGIDGAKVKTTGWRKINNKDYYFNYDYSAATGRTVINGKTYEFGSDGVLIKEVVAVKKNGLISENGRTYYYIDDAKQYGWKYLGTNVAPSTGWYFFGNNGAMATGWGKVDGKWYYFDANGKMLTGWNKIFYNGQMRWFYMSSNGDMKTGWQKINGTWYYLDENNGDMVTGWNKLPWDGKKAWFYFQEDGSMVKGWFYDVTDGNVYYMYSSGMMAAGVTQDGLKLDSAGKCLDVKGFFDSTLPYTSNIGC